MSYTSDADFDLDIQISESAGTPQEEDTQWPTCRTCVNTCGTCYSCNCESQASNCGYTPCEPCVD